MPNNLDLDAIKDAMSYLSSYWDSADFRGARHLTQEGMDLIPLVLNAAPAIIAEVERLRQESADFEAVCMSQEGQIARLMAELATAKRVGAAEALKAMDQHIMDLARYIDLENQQAAHGELDSIREIQESANARLIAAAPDLLEALRMWTEGFGTGKFRNQSKACQEWRAELWKKTNAAIAKAEVGESS
jgi:hypothetical protein